VWLSWALIFLTRLSNAEGYPSGELRKLALTHWMAVSGVTVD
jgi:hypothetical protein